MKLNICEQEILNNFQQNAKRKVYKVDFTSAIIDIGRSRMFQEDSVLITRHKDIQYAELLLVADGMGGLENGARASRLSALYLMDWFQNLSYKNLVFINNLKNQFSTFVDRLDEKIRQECGQGGTTMVCAFTVGDTILVANIGDSRAYNYSNGFLTQITTDHSVTQKLFEDRIIKEQGHIRFHKENNLILSRVGCKSRLLELDFYEIGMDCVDKLFLFSDGVTDCVSQKRLQELIVQSSEHEIIPNIMSEALNVDTFSLGLDPKNYYEKISAGKDNISIVYKNNRRINND